MSLRAVAVFLVLALGASAAAPSNPSIGALFPDCPGCPEPGPQPLQISRLVEPRGYSRDQNYEMALEVTPHHGLVSRFHLSVDKGVLASDDPNVRVSNSTTLGYVQPFVGGKAVWRFAWTAPPSGSGNATFTLTTMSGFGDGILGRDAWFTRRVVIPEGVPAPPPPSPGFEAAAALAVLGLVAVLHPRRG